MACLQGDAVAIDGEGAAAFDGYEHDEAVDGRVVERGGALDGDDGGAEVGTADDLDRLVGLRLVVCAIVGGHAIVDALGGLLGVELARLSVLVAAVVVVDAVGDVAGLLNFGHEAAAADGVDASCGSQMVLSATRCL